MILISVPGISPEGERTGDGRLPAGRLALGAACALATTVVDINSALPYGP